MQKNVAGQKLIVFAFDSTTNQPKTGDAANITAYVSIDYGAVTGLGDTSASEMESTNAKGYYLFDLTQGETNGNTLLFSAKSATSNIVVIGSPACVQTVPSSFVVAPGSAGAIFVGGSNAATTIAGLTTGAISATTITASGAVAFQSTFAVTTSTALGALSATTFATSGTTTFNAFTVTNNLLVSGTATITGATTFTGAVGATNAGNDIRGILLQGTQTFNLTGNITGNLSGSVGSVTGLTAANLDATISSRLASASISLSGGIVSADIKKVNAVTVNGDGAGTPWGP